MKDAIATGGTSPDVLQHYLTAGIEIEMLWFPCDEDRHRMRGLDGDKVLLEGGIGCHASACLPVLRPSSALTTVLEDGTVPAVEVAKILLAYQYDVKHHRYEAAHIQKVQYRQPGIECVQVTVPGLNDNLVIAIYNNLDLENEDRGVDSADVLAVVSYLRSKHFAVGLEPHQYIAKEVAPVSPTKQEGAES